MEFLKLYENYKNEMEIVSFCENCGISDYTINENGYIDVDGDVSLRYKRLSEIPFKFGRVKGKFDCGDNRLTTLKNSPDFCYDFRCSYNKITDLQDAPKEVLYGVVCINTKSLTSLKGCPDDIQFLNIIGSDNVYSFDYFPDSLIMEFELNDILSILLNLFKNPDLIYAFNDYNIIKEPSEFGTKPRLKLSNLNKFLKDLDIETIDGDVLKYYYDLK